MENDFNFKTIFYKTIPFVLTFTLIEFLGLSLFFHRHQPINLQIFVNIGTFLFIFNFIGYFLIVYLRNRYIETDLRKTFEARKYRAETLAYLSAQDSLKNSLLGMNTPAKICLTITEFIKKTFHVKESIIYLWEEEQGSFLPNPENEESIRFFVYEPFVLWLMDQDKIYTKENFLENSDYEQIRIEAIKVFNKTNAKLIIPLTLNSSLLGILTISPKDNFENFSNLELERLLELKSIAILSITNATFYLRLTMLTETLEQKVKERTTALEETQSQLVMSEKMASLGIMVAGIAHEINTPAGVINGSADNMEENINYIIQNFFRINSQLITDQNKEQFIHSIHTVLEMESKSPIEIKEKFKLKKSLKEKYNSHGIEENTSSDLASFVIERNLVDHEELLMNVVIGGGRDVYQYLYNITNMYKNLKNIKYSIKNIVRIVRALKYYSHLDQASFSEADIIESLENTLIIMHHQIKHGIEVIRNYKEIPRIYCNIDELNQVWTNIIQNAVHAMNKSEVKQLTISIYAEEKFICIEIKDTGFGIPKKILDRIWDPFFTTKDQGEGSGLGLGIVKGIIEKHRGKIQAASTTGNTVFSIRLPIAANKR